MQGETPAWEMHRPGGGVVAALPLRPHPWAQPCGFYIPGGETNRKQIKHKVPKLVTL